MKANRKFVQADEAVSPVIAVILMVAITVVLAATVFVLVSDIGSNTGTSQATISWSPDESNDKLLVITASQNADWNRLQVSVESCSSTGAGSVQIGGAAVGDNHVNVAGRADAASYSIYTFTAAACGTPTSAPARLMPANDRIDANDYIQFCGTGTVINAKIVIRDLTANALTHTHTFTDLTNCT